MAKIPANPTILYHYTSVGNLMKILDYSIQKNICIRATHAKYFNDPFEYSLAISLLKASMIRYEKEHTIENRKSQKFNKKKFSSFGIIAGYPFILSLSEKPDDLTMWRTYGADGKGVAIGLDVNILKEYKPGNADNTRLLKCAYTKDSILNGLTNYWSVVYDKIDFTEEGASIKSFRLLSDIANFCFSIKRQEYKDEMEWRLCKNEWEMDEIRFFERDGILIPFIEHFLPREIVKEIIIGPCANKKMTKESIETFLKARRYALNKDLIILSKVPYRRI